VRNHIVLLLSAMLVACGGPTNTTTERQSQPHGAAQVATKSTIDYIVPVEFGRRPPNTPMTSDNMPFFDTVTYCILATRETDTMVRGPEYEECIEHQDHTRIVLADAIDAAKYKEADIVRCAKASRTAYLGMWYCMNEQFN
jgi:hypothetical protein